MHPQQAAKQVGNAESDVEGVREGAGINMDAIEGCRPGPSRGRPGSWDTVRSGFEQRHRRSVFAAHRPPPGRWGLFTPLSEHPGGHSDAQGHMPGEQMPGNGPAGEKPPISAWAIIVGFADIIPGPRNQIMASAKQRKNPRLASGRVSASVRTSRSTQPTHRCVSKYHTAVRTSERRFCWRQGEGLLKLLPRHKAGGYRCRQGHLSTRTSGSR